MHATHLSVRTGNAPWPVDRTASLSQSKLQIRIDWACQTRVFAAVVHSVRTNRDGSTRRSCLHSLKNTHVEIVLREIRGCPQMSFHHTHPSTQHGSKTLITDDVRHAAADQRSRLVRDVTSVIVVAETCTSRGVTCRCVKYKYVKY